MADNDQQHIALWFAQGEPPCDWYRAFEAYGHAMATASAFEQLMMLLIVKAEVLRLGNRSEAKTVEHEQRLLFSILSRSTYDALMRRCMKVFKLSDALKTGLADGKEVRDYLAHNFWQAHLHNLWEERGLDIIASHCALSANHFRLAAIMLIEETGVDVADYIEMSRTAPHSKETFEGWERLFTA